MLIDESSGYFSGILTMNVRSLSLIADFIIATICGAKHDVYSLEIKLSSNMKMFNLRADFIVFAFILLRT